MKKDPRLHQNFQKHSGLKLTITLVRPYFLPKINNAKSEFQFILYKDKTSIQEGLDPQGNFSCPVGMVLDHLEVSRQNHQDQNNCTLEKKNLPMAFPMLHFPEPPKSPMLVFLVI